MRPAAIAASSPLPDLLAWDLDRGSWWTFRVDRLFEPRRTGGRFGPRRLPAEGAVGYVRAQIGAVRAVHVVRATVAVPAEPAREHRGYYGAVEPRDVGSSEVRINAASLDWAAFSLASMGAPFVVHGPAEAIEHIRGWAERLSDAAGDESPADCRPVLRRASP